MKTKQEDSLQQEGMSLTYCEYYKTICPPNIKKYSMKCMFGKEDCRIRKYFKKYESLDISKLGIGSKI